MRYFETDDGSLPEIEISFTAPEAIVSALRILFQLGARDVTSSGSRLWLRADDKEVPVTGPNDALLVANGKADSYHFVVDSINKQGAAIPALGVFVDPDALVLDYRMGPEWGASQIEALLSLLKDFKDLGGSVNVLRWWGESGQIELESELSVA
ncbi:MAG: hypothetical protein JNM60_03425 [Candidatus Competibacteraceae bacterium]|nr:hypothetical protein [Candidatus Competibacteraceae bacterium]